MNTNKKRCEWVLRYKNPQLNEKLKWLASLGCYPCISFRGKVWRAHINATGNQWDEGNTPILALNKAILQWNKAGRPMDGYASK